MDSETILITAPLCGPGLGIVVFLPFTSESCPDTASKIAQRPWKSINQLLRGQVFQTKLGYSEVEPISNDLQ